MSFALEPRLSSLWEDAQDNEVCLYFDNSKDDLILSLTQETQETTSSDN